MLALSVHSNPGVYALLVGSGISYGSGVATGWGVVEELVKRMALLEGSGDPLPDDFNFEQWWKKRFPDVELGYDAVLEATASTPADRRNLLEPFFVPTEDDLAAGQKVPAPAHKAIARLVKRHSIRVIVTTNFDDLIEKALNELGVSYQVVASPSDVEGVDALRHSPCTVIKVHGDYKRIDMLNTKDELATYRDEINKLLDAVFDEYGLVICGWSGDWDHALNEAVNRAPARRYPLYWSARGRLGGNATRLVQQRRGTVVPISDADSFFVELADRLDILDRMANPPLTRDLALGQLKRYLPDPGRYLDLRDLFEGEVRRARTLLNDRPLARGRGPLVVDGVHAYQSELDQMAKSVDVLIHLLAHGITLDTRREHDYLWVWVIEQLMRACRQTPRPGETMNDSWMNLGYYPAWLVLRAAALAATEAKRDDLFIRLFLEPSCHHHLLSGDTLTHVPAVAVLYEYRGLHDALEALLPATRDRIRISKHLGPSLLPIFAPIVGNTAAFDLLSERVEYRLALVQEYVGRAEGVWAPVLEYSCYYDRFGQDGSWKPAHDFAATFDEATWVDGLGLKDAQALSDLRSSLATTAASLKWF
ncbi:SIR2 family protein [Prescottella equi]